MANIILIVGSLNMDLITRTTKMPSAGETLTALSFSTGPGGKGANQAVACARASKSCSSKDASLENDRVAIEVRMAGAVGDDMYGEQLKSELSKNGINTDSVATVCTETSGVAVIVVEEETGENRILITPGANASVNIHQLHSLRDTLSSVQLIVLQLEIPLETVFAIMDYAKKHQIDIVLNPAPAVHVPDQSLHGLGHLIMNESEAGILAGIGEDISTENDVILGRIFDKFDRLGVRNTILTLGAQGVCYSVGSGDYRKVPACRVDNVVDTTAAGDTFVGYYAVEVVRCKSQGLAFDVQKAVIKANKAAGKTVERAGAMSSIPWMDELI